MTISFINNDHKHNLFTELNPLIKKSKTISIAVAFLKSSGLELIRKELIKTTKRGAKINIIAGLDFGMSDAEALKELLDMKEEHNNMKLQFAIGEKGVFHPKMYMFVKGRNATIIIGSANLTKSGLVANTELLVRIDCKTNMKIYKDAANQFASILKQKDVFDASYLSLERYKPFNSAQKEVRNKKIFQKPKSKSNGILDNLNMNELLSAYNEYKKEYKNRIPEKVNNYEKAKHKLNRIASLKNITSSKVTPFYASLVGGAGYGHLWDSRGINRSINRVIKYPVKLQNLVRYIKSNNHKTADVVFATAMQLGRKIPGVGINIVTEMLASYDPQKYCVVNNSPIEALKLFGCKIRSKNSFDGEYYYHFCKLMYEIQKCLNVKSLLTVDGFFNYIFYLSKNKN